MDLDSDQFDWFKASSNKNQFKSRFRQNRDNIEALRLKQLANQEIEKSRDFESMEKYRQMGLSEDEAKIHLKREKRAEKVEKDRRLQIEAEAGFQIEIKNDRFWRRIKSCRFWSESI